MEDNREGRNSTIRLARFCQSSIILIKYISKLPVKYVFWSDIPERAHIALLSYVYLCAYCYGSTGLGIVNPNAKMDLFNYLFLSLSGYSSICLAWPRMVKILLDVTILIIFTPNWQVNSSRSLIYTLNKRQNLFGIFQTIGNLSMGFNFSCRTWTPGPLHF